MAASSLRLLLQAKLKLLASSSCQLCCLVSALACALLLPDPKISACWKCFNPYAGFAMFLVVCCILLDQRPVCPRTQIWRMQLFLSADEKRTFTMKMSIGITMALTGFCMYSHTKIKQQPAGLPVKALTDPMDDHETKSLLQEQHKGAHWKGALKSSVKSRASEVVL